MSEEENSCAFVVTSSSGEKNSPQETSEPSGEVGIVAALFDELDIIPKMSYPNAKIWDLSHHKGAIAWPKRPDLVESIIGVESPYEKIEFTRFPRLKKLCLASSAIASLETADFPYLEDLDVSSTLLTTLNTTHLSNLLKLNISFCGIKQLSTTALAKLQSLIAYGSIMPILDVFPMRNLIRLELRESAVTDLVTRPLVEQRNVSAAYRGAYLLQVPALQLQYLNVSYTYLQRLDTASFRHLTWLESNQTHLIGLDTRPLYKLETLIMKQSRIYNLDLRHLVQLRHLNLANVKIKTIDVAALKQLDTLNLHGTFISKLPQLAVQRSNTLIVTASKISHSSKNDQEIVFQPSEPSVEIYSSTTE